MLVISQLGEETPICFNINSTHATQIIFSLVAIRLLSLYVPCSNTELVVSSLCKFLHVFVITLIHKGYLPNSLNTARFTDFLLIFDMYLKKIICSLSHRKFSNKCSREKSAFLVFDDKMLTVPHISLP